MCCVQKLKKIPTLIKTSNFSNMFNLGHGLGYVYTLRIARKKTFPYIWERYHALAKTHGKECYASKQHC